MMSEEEAKKELGQISATLRQFDEYSNQLKIQLETLRTLLLDLSATSQTLANLKEESELEETLCQLGAGVSIKVKPIESNKVLYNIGAGVVVSKSVDEAIEILSGRIVEVEREAQAIAEQMTLVYQQMRTLEDRGQMLLQQIQEPPKPQYDPSLVD